MPGYSIIVLGLKTRSRTIISQRGSAEAESVKGRSGFCRANSETDPRVGFCIFNRATDDKAKSKQKEGEK